jgi:predicted esterase
MSTTGSSFLCALALALLAASIMAVPLSRDACAHEGDRCDYIGCPGCCQDLFCGGKFGEETCHSNGVNKDGVAFTGMLPPGNYSTGNAKIEIASLKDRGHDTIIYWPETSEAGPFPLIVFGHGMGHGGERDNRTYHGLMSEVASHGFTVISPTSCDGGVCPSFDMDLLRTFEAATTQRATLHPSLAKAGFAKTGLIGHSQGGSSAMKACKGQQDYNISALAALHPWMPIDDIKYGKEVHVPAMYTTGSEDTLVPPSDVLKAYKRTDNAAKTFIELAGAGHDESYHARGGRLGPYMAEWMRCHLLGDSVSCAYFTANGKDQVCGSFNMTQCILPSA